MIFIYGKVLFSIKIEKNSTFFTMYLHMKSKK